VRVPAAGSARSDTRPTADVSIDALFRQNVQPVYFDYDKAEIRPDQIQRLRANALWFNSHRDMTFTIEGHSDERGSDEYNIGLADRRANTVVDFLIGQGVPRANMRILSYGEERPSCREMSETCYARNRRAAFALSGFDKR
jgi:peptidoglycan-associated lipoprotein